jgi:hypothetical protein
MSQLLNGWTLVVRVLPIGAATAIETASGGWSVPKVVHTSGTPEPSRKSKELPGLLSRKIPTRFSRRFDGLGGYPIICVENAPASFGHLRALEIRVVVATGVDARTIVEKRGLSVAADATAEPDGSGDDDGYNVPS